MKKMVLLTLKGPGTHEDAKEIFLDPFNITSIIPDKTGDGSIITMKQKNYFRVEEKVRQVLMKCYKVKRMTEETMGNQE